MTELAEFTDAVRKVARDEARNISPPVERWRVAALNPFTLEDIASELRAQAGDEDFEISRQIKAKAKVGDVVTMLTDEHGDRIAVSLIQGGASSQQQEESGDADLSPLDAVITGALEVNETKTLIPGLELKVVTPGEYEVTLCVDAACLVTSFALICQVEVNAVVVNNPRIILGGKVVGDRGTYSITFQTGHLSKNDTIKAFARMSGGTGTNRFKIENNGSLCAHRVS